jgi:hypothetical protein
MLRSVLGDYLDKGKEREFDLPLMFLLPAMGFYDVHFTHGQVEFGKDFIAKKLDNEGRVVQYSIQSKVGDISYADWRDGIQGQILESVLITLSHPNFDTNLPHQAVLLTTGRLKGNAQPAFQNPNEKIETTYQKRPIIFWDREDLVNSFEQFGLTGIHRASAAGFADDGRFFLLYGKARQGDISDREIEEYSRQWLDTSLDHDHRLLRCAVEAAVLAQQCVEQGRIYEAICAHLAQLRTLCMSVYAGLDQRRAAEYHQRGVARLHDLCASYFTEIRRHWLEQRNVLRMMSGPAPMATYLAQCARIMDVAALVYFTASDEPLRSEASTFLEEFILSEPGCSQPLSDHYAVTTVLAALVLCGSGKLDVSRDLIQRVTVWLCDRHESGLGLARFGADEATETRTLLGYPFEFIDVPKPGGSFLATALCDLAAFLEDRDLYRDVVNDIMACGIYPQYWQASDTIGVCSIEGADVVGYPHVRYKEELTRFGDYDFAEHIMHEPASFQIMDTLGTNVSILLMAFLRDRYFPRSWPLLVPGANDHPTGTYIKDLPHQLAGR